MVHFRAKSSLDSRKGVLSTTVALLGRDEVRFWTMWWFIALVSLLDLHLTIHFRDSILMLEESLLCRTLIMLDPDELSVFIPAKLTGTALCLAILRTIYRRLREHSMIIVSGVAGFQSWLLIYLTLA